MTAQNSPAFALRNVSKGFPGIQALDDVSFTVREGEIHALTGENGAGKSTVINLLSGLLTPDAGSIQIRGQDMRLTSSARALAAGVATIHQELTIIPGLSVAENLYLGQLPARFGWVRRRQLERDTSEVLKTLGIELDPRARLESLSIGHQQLVEIGKALARNTRILIMDEPTSALSRHETDQLLASMRNLCAQGCSILFVSHKLDEVFAVADRITVLRDGKLVRTDETAAVTPDQLVAAMVGRELQSADAREPARIGEVILELTNGTKNDRFADVSFSLREGEILGLSGLVGAGRTDVARCLFGAERLDVGRIHYKGRPVQLRSPRDAIDLGIALVPESRRDEGILPGMSVSDNVGLPTFHRFANLGVLNASAIRASVTPQMEKLDIRASAIDTEIQELSGGNQQKAILARWLLTQSRVLIADEPTRGVDVGAKAAIYALLQDLARQGMAVLLISSELPELLHLCDRILVMREGRIVHECDREEANEEALAAAALGVAAGV